MEENLVKGKVRLRTPVDGYTNGVLTGVEKEDKHEILLPSGKTIWLFSYEFVRLLD